MLFAPVRPAHGQTMALVIIDGHRQGARRHPGRHPARHLAGTGLSPQQLLEGQLAAAELTRKTRSPGCTGSAKGKWPHLLLSRHKDQFPEDHPPPPAFTRPDLDLVPLRQLLHQGYPARLVFPVILFDPASKDPVTWAAGAQIGPDPPAGTRGKTPVKDGKNRLLLFRQDLEGPVFRQAVRARR